MAKSQKTKQEPRQEPSAKSSPPQGGFKDVLIEHMEKQGIKPTFGGYMVLAFGVTDESELDAEQLAMIPDWLGD